LEIFMERFEGKVALVTGAGSGIGRATAERIASEGGTVFCVDLNLETATETVAGLDSGGRGAACACDVSDAEQVNSCVAACITEFGQLDVLVNMAGLLRFERTHEMSLENWQQIIDINLTGTWLMCKAAIPHLLETEGNIVNAASTASQAGLKWGAAYSASKGGVLAMTRSIAVEYATQGLRANTISPGDIKTNMTVDISMPAAPEANEMLRISSRTGAKGPQVVAGVIAMLASEDGAHITGEDVRMDGGTLA
jgi:meso-butanediol dehydrogenase/(S,S)-butanediol dehydrogenase/diacetyl reductase